MPEYKNRPFLTVTKRGQYAQLDFDAISDPEQRYFTEEVRQELNRVIRDSDEKFRGVSNRSFYAKRIRHEMVGDLVTEIVEIVSKIYPNCRIV